MYYFKKIWNPIRINELAYEIEKKQHGNPSGGDNTAVTMGGFIWFRKELEFLKSIWQLPFKPHPSVNHFFLINTGRPKETTGEMVAYVRSQFTVHSSQFEKLFNENEKQVKRVTTALKEGDEKGLLMRSGLARKH
jgi:mevalonate kinase